MYLGVSDMIRKLLWAVSAVAYLFFGGVACGDDDEDFEEGTETTVTLTSSGTETGTTVTVTASGTDLSFTADGASESATSFEVTSGQPLSLTVVASVRAVKTDAAAAGTCPAGTWSDTVYSFTPTADCSAEFSTRDVSATLTAGATAQFSTGPGYTLTVAAGTKTDTHHVWNIGGNLTRYHGVDVSGCPVGETIIDSATGVISGYQIAIADVVADCTGSITGNMGQSVSWARINTILTGTDDQRGACSDTTKTTKSECGDSDWTPYLTKTCVGCHTGQDDESGTLNAWGLDGMDGFVQNQELVDGTCSNNSDTSKDECDTAQGTWTSHINHVYLTDNIEHDKSTDTSLASGTADAGADESVSNTEPDTKKTIKRVQPGDPSNSWICLRTALVADTTPVSFTTSGWKAVIPGFKEDGSDVDKDLMPRTCAVGPCTDQVSTTQSSCIANYDHCSGGCCSDNTSIDETACDIAGGTWLDGPGNTCTKDGCDASTDGVVMYHSWATSGLCLSSEQNNEVCRWILQGASSN
jgi:hypothetical protein